MSIVPIITFKAGTCDFEPSANPKVSPRPTPGYIYLFEEDELIQFCWRPRSAPMSSPTLQLSMVPTDGTFLPYKSKSESSSDDNVKSPTNGRIFVLKFQSSSARHLFWLQSKSQHSQGDASWFSPRDLKLGSIVNELLQGEEVNVNDELAAVEGGQGQGGDGGDTEMEDARPEGGEDIHGNVGGGPLGEGNQENEGSGSRDAGGDGGRAQNTLGADAALAVRNFVSSLQGNSNLQSQSSSSIEGNSYTTLMDLLSTSTTIPVIDSLPLPQIDSLLQHLPPVILTQAQNPENAAPENPTPEAAAAAIEALSLDQKKEVLRKVLRSAQFSQSLGSLTQALRDGGLPMISDALGVSVRNGGYVRRGGGVPLGGGDAVEAFVQGVKEAVEKEQKDDEGKGESMETD